MIQYLVVYDVHIKATSVYVKPPTIISLVYSALLIPGVYYVHLTGTLYRNHARNAYVTYVCVWLYSLDVYTFPAYLLHAGILTPNQNLT